MTDDPIKRLFRSRKRRWTKEPLAALTNEDHGDIERAEMALLEALGRGPESEGPATPPEAGLPASDDPAKPGGQE